MIWFSEVKVFLVLLLLTKILALKSISGPTQKIRKDFNVQMKGLSTIFPHTYFAAH